MFLSFFVIILIVQPICSQTNKSDTLVLVHAIFRHGDRTSDRNICYPNDPYRNETYHPFGLEQLTNEGKRRQYNLGRYLRQRYDKFLGELYLPGLIDARSTDFDRTKMSLQLVLSGLFPPKDYQRWLYALNWQPVPYNYESASRDKILEGVVACPNYIKYLLEHEKSEQVQKIWQQHSDTLDYVAKHTGCVSSNLFSAALLYFTLTTESEWGFVLPNWTDPVYPDKLQKIVTDCYLIGSGTAEMKQITSGFLIEKIMRDTQLKINGDLTTKLFLYSAHENNIAFLLNTLNIFQPHVPPYGACILIEVHYVNKEYRIKIIYENYLNIHNGVLTIPGCEEFCPLEKFISFVQEYFPDENVCSSKELSRPMLPSILEMLFNRSN